MREKAAWRELTSRGQILEVGRGRSETRTEQDRNKGSKELQVLMKLRTVVVRTRL